MYQTKTALGSIIGSRVINNCLMFEYIVTVNNMILLFFF